MSELLAGNLMKPERAGAEKPAEPVEKFSRVLHGDLKYDLSFDKVKNVATVKFSKDDGSFAVFRVDVGKKKAEIVLNSKKSHRGN